jgi:CheY-like chemotaxis protein
MKSGPIILLEDDNDDHEIFKTILDEIGIKNQLIWFTRADEAFHFLKTTSKQPFIIFSDVNLPGKNGIEFKKEIDQDPQLRAKSIPFVFYSTSIEQKKVNEAYTQMTVQGFFQKSSTYEEIKRRILIIMDYWKECKHPNTS